MDFFIRDGVQDTKLLTVNLVIVSKMTVATLISKEVCVDGRKTRDQIQKSMIFKANNAVRVEFPERV